MNIIIIDGQFYISNQWFFETCERNRRTNFQSTKLVLVLWPFAYCLFQVQKETESIHDMLSILKNKNEEMLTAFKQIDQLEVNQQ